MKNCKLTIRGREIPLPADAEVALTLQINDLATLVDRQASRSNQFKLPKTAEVLEALEGCDQIESTTDVPYLKNEARLEMNGEQVIPKGFAIIENAGEFINITIYSGLIDFFELIESRKLSELDLTTLNHFWTLVNVVSSRTNTSGYKYPVIQYGDLLADTRVVDVRNQRFAVFVQDIINAIFTDAEFAKVGDIFSDANYLKTLLPFSADVLTGRDTNYLAKGVVSVDTPIGTNFFPMDDSNSGIDPNNLINLETFPVLPSAATKYFYKAETNGLFRITLSFDYTDGDVAGFVIDGYIKVPSTPNMVPISQEGPAVISPSGTIAISHDVQMNAGDYFAYRIDYFGSAGNMVILASSVGFEVTQVSNIILAINNEVDVAMNLPDMTQKDLVKTIANQYALFFARDPFTKTIYAARMNDIEANKPYAINWSSKLHMGDEGKLDYRLDKYAQKNYLKYVEDTTDKDIIKGTGDGYFECQDQTLKAETTLITLPVSASQMQVLLQGLSVPCIRKIDDNGNFNIKIKPRMVIDNTQSITGEDLHFHDGGGPIDINTNIPLCYFQLPDKDFNLGFDDSLIPDYYNGLTKTLRKAKKITRLFNLTANDIIELDEINVNTGLPNWFTPRYLWQFSSYFYVNKVESFKGYGLTKVELIRLGGGDVCVPTFGAELILSQDYSSVAWGVSQAGDWTLLNGSATHTPSGIGDQITYTFSPFLKVTKYKVAVTVSGMTQGSASVTLGDVNMVQPITDNGTYTEIVSQTTPDANLFYISVTDDFDGTITFTSVKEQLTCL